MVVSSGKKETDMQRFTVGLSVDSVFVTVFDLFSAVCRGHGRRFDQWSTDVPIIPLAHTIRTIPLRRKYVVVL